MDAISVTLTAAPSQPLPRRLGRARLRADRRRRSARRRHVGRRRGRAATASREGDARRRARGRSSPSSCRPRPAGCSGIRRARRSGERRRRPALSFSQAGVAADATTNEALGPAAEDIMNTKTIQRILICGLVMVLCRLVRPSACAGNPPVRLRMGRDPAQTEDEIGVAAWGDSPGRATAADADGSAAPRRRASGEVHIITEDERPSRSRPTLATSGGHVARLARPRHPRHDLRAARGDGSGWDAITRDGSAAREPSRTYDRGELRRCGAGTAMTACGTAGHRLRPQRRTPRHGRRPCHHRDDALLDRG